MKKIVIIFLLLVLSINNNQCMERKEINQGANLRFKTIPDMIRFQLAYSVIRSSQNVIKELQNEGHLLLPLEHNIILGAVLAKKALSVHALCKKGMRTQIADATAELLKNIHKFD